MKINSEINLKINGLKVLTKRINTNFGINKLVKTMESNGTLSIKMLPRKLNQLSWTFKALELAKHNLLLSGGNEVIELLKNYANIPININNITDENIDKIKYFTHTYLLNSILYYNTVFDYFCILL